MIVTVSVCLFSFALCVEYSSAHISWHELVLAGNQDNHQNLVPFMLTYKFWLIFMGMKQESFFCKKKFKMANSKEFSFSTPPILNIFCENFRDWSLG